MPMHWEATHKLEVDKSAAEVWKVLWDDFADAHKILANVKGTNKVVQGPQGFVARELDMMNGSTVTETLFSVDKEKYRLPYDVTYADEGMQAMMGPWKATWIVEPISETKSYLIRFDETKLSYWPPYFLMGPLLRIMFKPLVMGMMTDVKHYAETGKVSPAKVEAMSKLEEEKVAKGSA